MVTGEMALRYRIVRYMPRAEAEEFANIGIVATAPEAGFFAFRLRERSTRELRQFFGSLDQADYDFTVGRLKQELTRIEGAESFPRGQRALIADCDLGALYSEMVRPREGAIRFSDERIVLTDAPYHAVDLLFERYVDRRPPQHIDREYRLLRRVRDTLHRFSVRERFRSRRIGGPLFQATFPFVEDAPDGRPIRIIKPLFLGQATPTDIIEHADRWASAVRRLKHSHHLPDAIYFVAEPPDAAIAGESPLLSEAYQAATDGIRAVGAQIGRDDQVDALAAFLHARAAA